MRTKVALLALASTVASVKAACNDAGNFISETYGFAIGDTTIQLTAAQAEENKYCSLAEDDEVCCTKETYLSFQTKATELVADLQELAGERDKYIIESRGDVLEVRDSLNRIVSAIEGAGESNPNAIIAALLLASFGSEIEAITTGFDELKANFLEFQKARVTCMEKLIETQVSAWCLACVDDFDALDYVDITTAGSETITYANTVGSGLTTACYDYVKYSAEQSQIISLYAIRTVFSSLATIVEKVLNNDASYAEDLVSVGTALGRLSFSDEATEKPVSIPTSCTSTSCTWFTGTAFANGLLANQTIIQGGTVLTSIPSLGSAPSSRRLEEAVEGRKLQTEWTPVSSGVSITFDDNPGQVDNDANSAARNGVVACAIAALAAMVI